MIRIDQDDRRIGLSIKALEEGAITEEAIKAAGEEVTAALKTGEALGDMSTIFGNAFDNPDQKQD